MFTQASKRNMSPSSFEMTVAYSPEHKTRTLQKLGANLITCMQKLMDHQAQLLVANDVKKMSALVAKYKEEQKTFIQLQKSLLEVEDGPYVTRLKDKVKGFLEKFAPKEVETRLRDMIERRTTAHETNQWSSPPKGHTAQLQVEDITEKLLNQQMQKENQEIKVLERMMLGIKDMSLDISKLITSSGQRINLTLESMTKAEDNLKSANQQLIETNNMDQNTNRKNLGFCLLIVVLVTVVLMIMMAASG